MLLVTTVLRGDDVDKMIETLRSSKQKKGTWRAVSYDTAERAVNIDDGAVIDRPAVLIRWEVKNIFSYFYVWLHSHKHAPMWRNWGDIDPHYLWKFETVEHEDI